MKCPFCGRLKNHVLESRSSDDGLKIRRRRYCEVCKKRFTTYERANPSVLWVWKKNGKRELYDRNKLRRGILKAVEKRPVSEGEIDEIVEIIERKMLSGESEEVSSKQIGKEVLRLLKKTDTVAWLRFASVYLEFENLDDFEKAILKAMK